MKKHLYLITLITLLFITFNLSPAKAAASNREPQKGNNGGSNNNNSATCLPINSAEAFLIIAGIVIGIVTLAKTKTAKAN